MDEAYKKKLKRLGYIYIFHAILMPCVIMVIVSLFEIDILTIFGGPGIAALWMWRMGGVYAKKIAELKRENDAKE